MYRIYIDDILQRDEDILNITDVFETSIVRQDGFNSQSQILREKSEAQLSFTGEAYKYVCDKLKEDNCHVFTVKIKNSCGYSYNGTMSVAGMEFSLHTKRIKTDIKDDSFSAYIDGFLDTKVPLYSTKTKNCEDITIVMKPFLMSIDATVGTLGASPKTIQAFDFLEAFRYIIQYLTDNKITVESDYLTTNKFAFTTGYNMHNTAVNALEKFTNVTFQELFDELRKKLRLYMSVEYNEQGNPYLKIEQESYFYTNDRLFTIPEIPISAVQTYDINRNFNQIKAGSSTFKKQEGTGEYFPQDRYYAWNKENYIGCGTCVGEKDAGLNLTSEFIIDSNLIYEALLAGAGQYDNDGSVFMFEYDIADGITVGKKTLASNGKWNYNMSITNINVLNNYIDYYQKCYEITRSPNAGFLCNGSSVDGFSSTIVNYSHGGFVQNSMLFQEVDWVYDILSSLTETSHDFGYGTDSLTIFTCLIDGDYNFNATINNILQRNELLYPMNDVVYELQILVYEDNTFNTLVYPAFTVSGSPTNPVTDPISLSLDTGLITLASGNVVFARWTETNGYYPGANVPVLFYGSNQTFSLIDSDNSCTSVGTNDTNSRPFIMNFKHPISISDYNIAKNNKKGYIEVGGTKMWIKELKYIDNKKSDFTLIYNDIVCNC